MIKIFKKNQYLSNFLSSNVKNIKNIVYNIQGAILIFLLLGVGILQFSEIFMRFVFGKSFMGVGEILTFATIWLVFIGSANASLEGTQINAKIIEKFIKDAKTIKLYKILMATLSFILCCVMTYFAYNYFQYSLRINKLTPLLYFRQVYAEVAILIGFLLMTLYSFLEILGYLRKPTHEIL